MKWRNDPCCSPCRYARTKAAKLAAGVLCVEEGCGRPATAGDLCHSHYSARHRLEHGRNYSESTRDADRARQRAYYHNRGAFIVADDVRDAIYERDGWTCQLCNGPVPRDVHYLDRLAPTLDHIVPQSLQIVPDHSPSNLRLAHRSCNSRRGNRVDAELALTLTST